MKPIDIISLIQSDLKKTSGIYMILFLTSGKAYIGQSINIDRRWVDHKSRLKHGSKHNKNPFMQNSYNKYGFNDMKFLVVENCIKADLNDREAFWINQIDKDLRLNLAGVGSFKTTQELIESKTSKNKGSKRTEECRKRMSEASKGKPKSEEHKQNLSIAVKFSAARPEVKENMSKAQKGKKHSPETIAKRTASMKGKKNSPETIAKRVESVKRFHLQKGRENE